MHLISTTNHKMPNSSLNGQFPALKRQPSSNPKLAYSKNSRSILSLKMIIPKLKRHILRHVMLNQREKGNIIL